MRGGGVFPLQYCVSKIYAVLMTATTMNGWFEIAQFAVLLVSNVSSRYAKMRNNK